MPSVTDEVEQKMQAALAHLQSELNSIRTSRANPAMLDSIKVEIYGTQMRLRDVAGISVPEPRQILISPYDASNSAVIGKSIEKANLGFSVVVDGNAVRVLIPTMDQKVREDMVKLCKRRSEEGKVSIRNVRRDFNDKIRRLKSDGDMAEDEVKRIEKRIQELTDNYCKKTDDLATAKEKQILEV